MNGKFSFKIASSIYREELFAKIDYDVSETEGYPLGEVCFPDPDTDEVHIRIYDIGIPFDAYTFTKFLQSAVEELVDGRAPKGQRRIEDIVWDEDKQWPEENK